MNAAKNVLTVIGISPRNPHFTKENIGLTLDAVLRKNASAHIFIPEVIDAHNYLAYGYSEAEALKKAHLLGQHFKKIVRELCADRRYTCADTGRSTAQVRIIDWRKEVEAAPLYIYNLAEMKGLYKPDAGFRRDVRRDSLHSLQSRMNHDKSGKTRDCVEKTGIDKCVDQAVNYILSELAFIDAAPEVFNGHRVIYVYHKEWKVFENLITGAYDNRPRPKLGFRIVANALNS
jgi:tRNA-dependent cyclodipeptide synthase